MVQVVRVAQVVLVQVVWGWICGMILPQFHTDACSDSGTEVTNKDYSAWVVRPQITLVINNKSARQNKHKNQ